MKIYLHAGHFKTGTTAFQRMLHAQREDLAAQSIYVPRSQAGNHGYRMACNFATGRIESRLAAELASAAGQGYRSCILSAEVIAHFDAQEFRALGALLAPYPVELVLVLRPWAEFLLSRYQQNIKRGDYLSLTQFLSLVQAQGDAHPDCNYARIVELAGDHFDTVRLLPYAANAAPLAILRQAGLDAPTLGALLKAAPRLNVSQGLAQVEMLRVYNEVVGRPRGWPADRKARQALDRRTPVAVIESKRLLRQFERAQPQAYAELAALVDGQPCELDLGPLLARCESWAARLAEVSAAAAVVSELPADFLRPTRRRVHAYALEAGGLPASLQTALRSAHERDIAGAAEARPR